MIRKYGLNMSRQAFREKAEDIGFQKVRVDGALLCSGARSNGRAVTVESS